MLHTHIHLNNIVISRTNERSLGTFKQSSALSDIKGALNKTVPLFRLQIDKYKDSCKQRRFMTVSLRLFGLKPLTNLHHFLIYALLFSV